MNFGGGGDFPLVLCTGVTVHRIGELWRELWHGGAYRVPPQAGASRGLELENTGERPCGTLRGLPQGAFSAFRARAELFRTVTLSRPRAWRRKVHSPRAIGGALWGRIPGTPQASPGTAQAHRRGHGPRCGHPRPGPAAAAEAIRDGVTRGTLIPSRRRRCHSLSAVSTAFGGADKGRTLLTTSGN